MSEVVGKLLPPRDVVRAFALLLWQYRASWGEKRLGIGASLEAIAAKHSWLVAKLPSTLCKTARQSTEKKTDGNEIKVSATIDSSYCDSCRVARLAVIHFPCLHIVTCENCTRKVSRCPACLTLVTYRLALNTCPPHPPSSLK